MTAQTATYGMDYLNHAQPKDVLVWIRMNVDILPDVGSKISKLFNHNGTLTIPCHQFAASVIGRHIESCVWIDSEFAEAKYIDDDVVLILVSRDNAVYYINCPINPFTGLLNPDGTQRTRATREEIEQWKKEG
jgi:hypothetical protein